MRVHTSPNLEAILTSRGRGGLAPTETDINGFNEEKIDMMLRIKGFSTVQDEGINFLVGEYEAMPKGAEQMEENMSTVDRE